MRNFSINLSKHILYRRDVGGLYTVVNHNEFQYETNEYFQELEEKRKEFGNMLEDVKDSFKKFKETEKNISLSDVFLTEASVILGDTSYGLTGGNIVSAFNSYAFDFNVSEIPYNNTPLQASNKRTALLENLRRFDAFQQYKIISELCNHSSLKQPIDDRINKLKLKLVTQYGKEFDVSSETLNISLVDELKTWLSKYPESEALYDSAFSKLKNNIFQRNLIDDLRLSLEILLKEICSNTKSLEHQSANIGSLIKQKGCSVEFRNMFQKLIEYYTKYQNNNIKHNDAVIEDENRIYF